MSLQCTGLVLACAHECLDFPFPASCIPHLAVGAHPATGACPGMSAHPFLHFSQANLVAAFEQSLVSMTSRLRHLAETAEEKVGAEWALGGTGGAGGCSWGWGMLGSGEPAAALPTPGVLSARTLWLPALLPQDTELLDLRETIDFLKKKNSEAQAVIQGALNGTDVTPKGKAWCCSSPPQGCSPS